MIYRSYFQVPKQYPDTYSKEAQSLFMKEKELMDLKEQYAAEEYDNWMLLWSYIFTF